MNVVNGKGRASNQSRRILDRVLQRLPDEGARARTESVAKSLGTLLSTAVDEMHKEVRRPAGCSTQLAARLHLATRVLCTRARSLHAQPARALSGSARRL